jgi:myo-inositol 2-dehydrogenase/D-chiro-inositol 1-dehydrogenase
VLGVAVVGLGAIARAAHLPAVERHPDVRLVAVADPSAEERAGFAAAGHANVAVLSSLDEVLGLAEVEAVVLATPPWVTPDLTVAAVTAGRFVLAEKPVATSLAATSAYDVLSAAERSRVQVGLTYRHDPAMVALHDLIAAGELGSPLLVRAHIYDEQRTADAGHRALIERTLEHGSPVVHEGAHVFDWFRYLFGTDPVVDDAWSLRTAEHLAAPNLVGARLTYGSTEVLVEFGWFTEALPACRIEVLGDRGRAVLDGTTFDLTVTTEAGERTFAPATPRLERCFDLQLTRFAELATGVRDRAEPDLADGIRALAASEEVATRAGATVRPRAGAAR